MRKKSLFIGIVGIFSVLTFWNLISSYESSRRAKAEAAPELAVANSGHLLDVTMTPETANMQVNEQKTIRMRLKPRNTSDYINAIYLSVRGDYGLQIMSVSQPFDQNGTSIPFDSRYSFTDITYDTAHIYHEFNGSQYPASIDFDLVVRKVDTYNSCSLKLDSFSSGAYYSTISSNDPYSYNSFDWGTLGSFRCVDVVPTTTSAPTANPTFIVSAIPSQMASLQCTGLGQPQNPSPAGTIFVTAAGQKLSWDPVTNAKFYGIEIWEASQVPSQGIKYTKIFTTSTVNTSYTFDKFLPDKQYLWKVSAIDACNNSWSQAETYLTVLGALPTVPPAYPTATPTVVLPPVTIKMRLRFQGIYTQPQRAPKTPRVFLVWIRNSDRENPIYKWVTAKYDQVGSWFIEDQWNIPPGDGYKVWIKGEKHLQRKICDGRPSDQESGFYKCGDENGQIVLSPGENYLDFSNVIMFAGDIPFKGESDGVLDAFDLSYIATHFDDKLEDIADLNFDGITDSQDFGIAVNAIRIQKYDETYPYKIHPFFRNVPLHEQFP